MKALKHRVEYGLIKGLEALVSAPPYEQAAAWGEGLGSVARRLMSRRDDLIKRNLSAAFPEKDPAAVERIAAAVWRNIGRVAVEFIRSSEAAPASGADPVDAASAEIYKRAVAEGKGVIVCAGHFCNWEINGIILHRFSRSIGVPFTAIARPMKNPLAGAWLNAKRGTSGMPTILHREAVKASLRKLRAKEAVGILFDQNLYQGGVFVPFFGRPAATTPLPALLHSRTGSPILFTHVRRENGAFRVFLERVDLPEAPEDKRLEEWSAGINRRLEAVVRRDPQWWFWIHNRWKRTAEAGAAPR